MDIVGRAKLNIHMLDAVARAALGAAICGVSVGAGVSRIHLKSHNLPNQKRASEVLSNIGALALVSGASRADIESAEPHISCCSDLISGDRALGYLRLQDDEIVEQGKVELIAGELRWTLRGLTAGVHEVFLFRLAGNYASGALRIRVKAS